MTATISASGFGLTLGQYGIVNSVGYPMGTSGTVSAGSSAAMQLITAIRSGGGQAPEPDTFIASGNNRRFKHKYTVAAEDVAQLDIATAVYDMDMHQHFTGQKRYEIGDWSFQAAEGNYAVGAIQSVIILTQENQDAASASFGVRRYKNWIYPLVTMTPLYTNFEEVTVAEYQLRGNPTQASKYPWGEALSATTAGVTRAARIPWYTRDYPGTFHTIVENGTTTSYTLGYTPAGTQASAYIKVWRNGTLLTSGHYAVTTSTKALVINTLGSSGDVVIVGYEATDLLSA